MVKKREKTKGRMGGMASWWAGELLLLFPSVSPVNLEATRRVCKEKEEYIITTKKKMPKEKSKDPSASTPAGCSLFNKSRNRKMT